MVNLNRKSFEPLYYQISENIRAMIETGDLKAGDRVPSENELIATYNVSRNTVRQALRALESRGLVYTMQGKGTFVAPEPMRYGLLNLTSFSEEMYRRGLTPGSRIIELLEEVPPAKIATRLHLEPGAKAFKVERLRLANGEPMALNFSYVPAELCPTLNLNDLEKGSLYSLLELRYGLRIGYADQVIKPTVATRYEADLLQVTPGFPLLLTEGVSFLENGTPVEYAKLIFRGDRYEFAIHAIRRPAINVTRE